MATNFEEKSKDLIFQKAQEKFRNVDAVVIHLVLTEYDFNCKLYNI